MAKKKAGKPVKVVTKEVATLLRKIKKDQDAKLVYVLVDHLRENGQPVEYIASKAAKHKEMVDYWSRTDMTGARLSRNEHIRRWNKWLIRRALKAFGPFTTSTGPSWEKRILDSAEELVAMRIRVRRLETAIKNRARKTLTAAKKHAPHLIRSVGGSFPGLGAKFTRGVPPLVVVGERDTMRQYPAIRLSSPQPATKEEEAET